MVYKDELQEKLHEAILNDSELIACYKFKQEALNKAMPVIVFDKVNNTTTVSYDYKTTDSLKKINLVIDHRIEQIKNYFKR
jgi:hypothetical protein